MRTSTMVAAVAILALTGGYLAFDYHTQQQLRTGIDRALAALPPGMTASYKSAHYAILSGKTVIGGLTLHGEFPGGPARPFDIAVDTLETENPNLGFGAGWANAAANPGSVTQDTVLPLADAVTLTGVTVRSAVVNLTEESFRFTKPRAYPWALLHDGMPSWQDIQAALTPRSQPPRLEDLLPILRAEAAAMLGVGYDGYEAGPAKVTETLPGVAVAYDIHKMTGGGFDRGVMQGASGENITFRGDKLGVFSVDRLTMGQSDLRAPMVRLVNGETLSLGLLDGVKIGRVEYGGITVQAPGHPAIHVGGLSVGPVAFAQGMPVSGEMGWTDVSISKAQITDPRARETFGQLGLDTMTLSFSLAYNWDVARQSATVHDTMLKVNELGTFTLAADLSNVIVGADALAQVRLAHARLRFDDASLVNRLLRLGAAHAGVDPNVYRQQIETIVRRQGDAAGGGPELTAAGQAAGDFIASPRSLTIELAPPEPVPVTTLRAMSATPGALVSLLGMTVSANQP